MNVPASLRSDQVAVMPWIGWLLCTGLDGRNGVDQVAGFTGMRTLGADNCLQTINPELAKQWHPKKNGRLTPQDVTPNSDKKAWWTCGSGHEWKATISNRNRGRGCPCCAGRAVCDDNCLQTVNPSLAAEWHPVENGRLTPRDVTPGSSKRVWWQCRKGHAWEAYIHSRSRGFGRCPYCRSR
ncbi:MAG: zinc-ribbon domain-containing protein [Syntrophobacteria bacterium]